MCMKREMYFISFLSAFTTGWIFRDKQRQHRHHHGINGKSAEISIFDHGSAIKTDTEICCIGFSNSIQWLPGTASGR